MRVDNNDNGNALPHVDVVSKTSVIALVITVSKNTVWPNGYLPWTKPIMTKDISVCLRHKESHFGTIRVITRNSSEPLVGGRKAATDDRSIAVRRRASQCCPS